MRHFAFRPSITMSGRTNNGLRGLSGKPYHPPLTDIPIAAYLFAALFDIISISIGAAGGAGVARALFLAGSWLMLGGVLVSLLAALTGWADWHRSSEAGTQARRTINSHAIIMLTVTAIAIVDVILRLTAFRAALVTPVTILVLTVVTGALVALGATYGGSLVFDYGFNVETGGDHPVWHASEVNLLPGQHPVEVAADDAPAADAPSSDESDVPTSTTHAA